MGLTVLSRSHLDHGLSKEQIAFVLNRFRDKSHLFKAEVKLPIELGFAPLGIYGPIAGDEPVLEEDVFYRQRAGRVTVSRMVDRPFRVTDTVSIIAGPSGLFKCCVYTMYGGFLAPREPDDPSISSDAERADAKVFWSRHALVPAERAHD